MSLTRIGILGYGSIAKKHMAAIAALPHTEVVAAHDAYAEPEGAVPFYRDMDSFLAQDMDLVSVCTPNGLHASHAIAALQAGHHVICEKPFALSSADCDQMIAKAKKVDRKIYCTMQNRFSPVSQFLKHVVEEEKLGSLYLINVSCYWNRNAAYYAAADWRGQQRLDGGTLFTQFSHYVDTVYWLFGQLKILNGRFANFDHQGLIDFEDTGIFNFTLDNGALGNFAYTTSCYEKNFESSLSLIGSRGTIKVAGQYMDKVVYCNVEGMTPPELPANDNLANIKNVYLHALKDLKGEANSATSAEDGRAVVSAIEEVYAFRTS